MSNLPPEQMSAHSGTTGSAGLVLATYTLQLIGPVFDLPSSLRIPESFRGMLREAEENITDLLPEGYSVKIREWDE